MLLTIVGGLLILTGWVWILQGANLMRVGFMAGQTQWLIAGILVLILGVGLLALASRQRRS